MPKNNWIEGYCTSRTLAKDLCWYMAIAPECFDVDVSEVKGMGWIVSCLCKDEKIALGQLHSLLKKRYFKVNWM